MGEEKTGEKAQGKKKRREKEEVRVRGEGEWRESGGRVERGRAIEQ